MMKFFVVIGLLMFVGCDQIQPATQRTKIARSQLENQQKQTVYLESIAHSLKDIANARN